MTVYRVNLSLCIIHSAHFIDAKCEVKIFIALN